MSSLWNGAPLVACWRGVLVNFSADAWLGVQACLRLVEKRETRYRVQWYYRLFEETQRGLTWGTSVEVVHGSLLALGELLRHTGRHPNIHPYPSYPPPPLSPFSAPAPPLFPIHS